MKLAPFTLKHVTQEEWPYQFTREQAAWPGKWLRELGKTFATVGRIDNVYGDRNLICSCPSVSEFFKYDLGKEDY